MSSPATECGMLMALLGMIPALYLIPHMDDMEPRTQWIWAGCMTVWIIVAAALYLHN